MTASVNGRPQSAAAPGNPMLATLSSRRDFDEEWIFERKLDGVRVLATRTRTEGEPRLLSRSGKPLNSTYPEIAEALAAQDRRDFTVDGEMVALWHGRTDFARLQQRMQLTDPAAVRASRVRVTYYLFDLLRLDGHDTTRLPLRTRKRLLRDAFAFGPPLRFTPHRNRYRSRDRSRDASSNDSLLDQACGRGWEGLIAKRADAPYVHRRSTDWLKLKCSGGQEFVIAGFTEPAGRRVGFGALLLGYYQDGRLRYAGKVGTGYDTATLRGLRRRLDGLERQRSPFADAEVRGRAAHWVRPELVAQVAFTEWTAAGLLRHPRYLGLRDDKAARDVVREQPAGRS
ncbi:non-homologous end-joining DNA ligase [Streptomyces sp. SKN60]|uniref:non-homologous end-joining DNA ligase n=1 Tax=Streptomyces sp. SKN60 TaxID=2855506 RepID=UPI0022472972|nr:non-homologous end-joining DNA ligase [Streptomyces sp. SKN60]MCX2182117.1 non-homologous end-joining DNA ligase [Streptomyces sp. SKN60]